MSDFTETLEVMRQFEFESWPDGSIAVVDRASGTPWYCAIDTEDALAWLICAALMVAPGQPVPTQQEARQPAPTEEQLSLF